MFDKGGLHIDEKIVGLSMSQWLPCPLAIWNLLFGKAILLNCFKPSSKKRGQQKADKPSKKNKKTKEDSGTTHCLYCSELHFNSKTRKLGAVWPVDTP